jgi:hypothetical protein
MGWPMAAAIMGSSLLPMLFGGNDVESQTTSQGPMYTPEQMEALKRMLGFAKTGEYGGYKAGEGYEGSLGSYDMTDMERGGQNSLMNLMNQAIGTQNFGEGMGKDELTKLLQGDKFDPYSEKGTYKGFKKQTLREGKEAQDRLKQNMAMTGDLYSTATGKESGLLQERTQDQLSSKLAELYQDYSDKKISAIPWALQSDQFGDQMRFREKAQNENIAMGRIGASQQYGGLQRMLDDMKAKDMYSEWQRSRDESKEPLKALESIYGNSADWGAKSMTAPGYTAESPWSKVLNNMIGLLARYGTSNWGQGDQGGNNYMNTNSDMNLNRWWE